MVITARLFTLVYDYNYGILNSFLVRLHIVDKPIDFLGDDRWTMPSMVAVGVFVSIPFTVYVFLAGLSAIPDDVYEAARIDGARPWQTYTRITLPLLRPAVLVARAPRPAPGGWRRARRSVLPLGGLGLVVVFLGPYLVMLLDALRARGDVLRSPATFFPQDWQLSTFGTVLSDARLLNWLKTSLLVATTSTLIVLVVAVPAAYFTARVRFPGRVAFLFLVLVTQMFSPTSLVVGLYRQFFEANLVNTYLSIILTNSAFNSRSPSGSCTASSPPSPRKSRRPRNSTAAAGRAPSGASCCR